VVVREAAAGVSLGIFRIEPDRLVVFGDGAVVVALVVVGEAATVVGDREISTGLPARLDDRRTAIDSLIGRKRAALVHTPSPSLRKLRRCWRLVGGILASICRDMGVTLMRTSYSTIFCAAQR
jgi:hypothetical protein